MSYWATVEDLTAWGRHAEHLLAQKLGRERWYQSFALRVCKVEAVRTFSTEQEPVGHENGAA